MKIATWNIAEGHTQRSAGQFDYNEAENRAYFAGQLRSLQPDVICLQESRCNTKRSLSQELE